MPPETQLLPTISAKVPLQVERNVLSTLESVPLENMWKCPIFSYHCYSYFYFYLMATSHQICSMDTYEKELSRKQAAWASKKYCGHRVLPETIMRELVKANIV